MPSEQPALSIPIAGSRFRIRITYLAGTEGLIRCALASAAERHRGVILERIKALQRHAARAASGRIDVKAARQASWNGGRQADMALRSSSQSVTTVRYFPKPEAPGV